MGDLEKRGTILTEPETGRPEEWLIILARIISRHLEKEARGEGHYINRKGSLKPPENRHEKDDG